MVGLLDQLRCLVSRCFPRNFFICATVYRQCSIINFPNETSKSPDIRCPTTGCSGLEIGDLNIFKDFKKRFLMVSNVVKIISV